MFKGSMVALVTPMHEDGSIDKASLQRLIEWHIDAKTDAIIIAGTTGESATLTPGEHFELISLAVKYADKRIPIIAGTGTNATSSSLMLTNQAKQAGADACLVVTPYYNKPTQKGLYQHFKTIALNVPIPIILYNVPSRTACDMAPETVYELSQLTNIIGIKEATGLAERAKVIINQCHDDFIILSGDDATALDLMSHGAQGVISVTANIAPEQMKTMCDAALSGDDTLAQQINQALMSLHQRLFLEANPIPAKWALSTMGKIQQGIRLPLLPLDPKYHPSMIEAMQHAGVI
jgi:4-hydroxy-tetrahydrodipicolinate synthase